MRGHLHLIERLNHVFPLKDQDAGLWASGYWELSDEERTLAKRLFLHSSKADQSHWGGAVQRVVPATDFAGMASKHSTDPSGRWVFVVRPEFCAKGVPWEGQRHSMAYKSLV